MSLPVRGEIWLADCGMAAKVRPVAVISVPLKESDRALIAVIPHTTSLVGSEFEMKLSLPWLEPGAFNVQATFPLAPPRFIRKLGVLSAGQLMQLESVLKRWQGLK